MKKVLSLFALCIYKKFAYGEIAKITGYWDCCKPSCALNGKAPVSSPVLSCSIDGWTTDGVGSEEPSVCAGGGGNAFACNFHIPWAANDNLSYGFAGAHVQGQGEWDWCCACYELTFISDPVVGKKMIVQITSTAGWPDETFFNLLIPGEGVGASNACKRQWGISDNGWGDRYLGVMNETGCQQLPNEIRSGCYWHFKWFKGTKNPFAKFRPVICPEELLNKTQCKRDAKMQYFNGSPNQTTKIRAVIQHENRIINRLVYWIAIPLAIIIVVTIPTFLIYRYRNKHIVVTKPEIDAFFKGEYEYCGQQAVGGENVATKLKYNKELYEISRTKFKVDMMECIGVGEFGKVCIGTVKRDNREEQVAVKMIKAVSRGGGSFRENKTALNGLLSEIKLLAYIGKHEHIVSLVGAYTEKLSAGHVLIFLELCKAGSLHKYLHNLSQSKSNKKYIRTLSANGDECENKCIFADLNTWAVQIADGMEFLTKKHLVHADLAARNILLDSTKTAKIGDFGLSKRLYNYTSYAKQQNQEPLPWRWMAPECLRRLVFNEKTDVWAFGITLWEMYTLGDLPYPGLNWEGNFPSRLEKGLRLEEPKHNLDGIYVIMLKCWDINPEKRPTFTDLKDLLMSRLKCLELRNFKN